MKGSLLPLNVKINEKMHRKISKILNKRINSEKRQLKEIG